MASVLIAGVDTSTQSTKVRVTDALTGAVVRFGQARHPDGTSVNPNAWWDAFLEAAAQAGGLDDVSALAVGGQQHGMVLLDRSGHIVRDALLWNDTRSAPQADAFIRQFGQADASDAEVAAGFATGHDEQSIQLRGRQRWVKATGSSPVASYTLTKIAWVAQHEPDYAPEPPPRSVCRTTG